MSDCANAWNTPRIATDHAIRAKHRKIAYFRDPARMYECGVNFAEHPNGHTPMSGACMKGIHTMVKTIAKADGVIVFDGYKGVELPIADLLTLPAQEASGKGIKLIDESKTVTLVDANGHDGSPVQFRVTLRVERTPATQGEADLMARTAERQAQGKALRDAKQEASENRLITAVQNTAISVAKQIQQTDTVGEAIKQSIVNRLLPGLPSAQ